MAQIKVYGHQSFLEGRQKTLSDIIHTCAVEALGLPEDKRFHRFIKLGEDDFFTPQDRSEQYIIIEISMFEGRTVETKKALLRALMASLSEEAGVAVNDIEITIFETPKSNWGIRGMPGDELSLSYKVDV